MGDTFSKSNPNSSSSSSPPTIATMSSSNPSQTQNSAPKTDPTHQPKSQESSDPPPIGNKENTPLTDTVLEGEEKKEVKEEEEGECGFCLFMKGGGCKDEFVNWEKCVEEGEKNEEDIVDKCFEVTKALKDCMLAHPDYYSPILQAEELAEAQAAKELEKEKEKEREENEKNVSSPNLSQTQSATPETDPTHQPKSQESSDPTPVEIIENNPQDGTASKGEVNNGVKEEEEEECGFCLFMKGGGCKDEFVNWEKCVEEGENNKEDIVDKCSEVTRALKDCMLAHPDYYSPILRAEEAAEAEAVKELEKEKQKEREQDLNSSGQKEAS